MGRYFNAISGRTLTAFKMMLVSDQKGGLHFMKSKMVKLLGLTALTVLMGFTPIGTRKAEAICTFCNEARYDCAYNICGVEGCTVGSFSCNCTEQSYTCTCIC
jgi:hypothetical protein